MEKKERLIQEIETIMNRSADYYREVFKTFYPAFGGNGLTERNQSFNFCRYYMDRVKNAVVWQELPIKYIQNDKKITGHIDSLIIDHSNKVILLIEAKRITNGVNRKIKSIKEDYNRLVGSCEFPHQKDSEIDKKRENYSTYEGYDTYILLLMDGWYDSNNRDTQRSKLIKEWESSKYFPDEPKPLSAKVCEVGRPNEGETYHIAYRLYGIS